MAILIDEKIEIQGFEVVLNKLGAILLEELSNQRDSCNNTALFDVFIERQQPYDKSEDVVIIVSLDNVNYSNFTESGSEGLCVYNVDIFTSATESAVETGNKASRDRLHLFAGWVRYILSSTKYKTLDLPPGCIGGTYVNSLSFDDNYGNQDGSFIRMSRVQFSVRINENQELFNGIDFLGNDTEIRIEGTDKGYKLIFNN
jgi:hypothetical protein